MRFEIFPNLFILYEFEKLIIYYLVIEFFVIDFLRKNIF